MVHPAKVQQAYCAVVDVQVTMQCIPSVDAVVLKTDPTAKVADEGVVSLGVAVGPIHLSSDSISLVYTLLRSEICLLRHLSLAIVQSLLTGHILRNLLHWKHGLGFLLMQILVVAAGALSGREHGVGLCLRSMFAKRRGRCIRSVGFLDWRG